METSSHRANTRNPAGAGRDKWLAWAQRSFGGDPVRVQAAAAAAKSALVAGATADAAAAAAREAAWRVWAQQHFGNEPSALTAAVNAIRQAQAAGTDPAGIAAAARSAVAGAMNDPRRAEARPAFGDHSSDAGGGFRGASAASRAGAAFDQAAFAGGPVHAQSDKWPNRPAQDARTRDPAHVGLGAYEYLVDEKSPIAREAMGLIAELEMSRRPRMIAFLGRRSNEPRPKATKIAASFVALVWVLILATHLSAIRKIDGPITPVSLGPPLVISGILLAAASVGYLWYVATVRYTFARGRLIVESGTLTRDAPGLELYRVTAIDIHESLPNRITGDATLVFTSVNPASGKPMTTLVTGLQPKAELEQTRNKLMDLAFALRSTPVLQRYLQ
jgi:hypothetical protein